MALTNSPDLFFAGGDCMLRHGVWVRRTSRIEDIGPTHTRSGAVGKFTDRDGVIREAEANQPRVTWLDLDGDGVPETPTLLLEAARTNLNDEDDISAWSNTATVNSTDDPAGGNGAYNVEDTSGGAAQNRNNVIGAAFSGTQGSLVAVVREADAVVQHKIHLEDTVALAERCTILITAWSSGEPTYTVGTGTDLGSRYIGNGYWAIYAQTATLTPANSHQIQIAPAEAPGTLGSIDIWRINAFDDPVPSFSILDASETRNADTFYADFPYPPQEMTVYAKFVERGTISLSEGGIVHIGSATGTTDPRLQLTSSGTFYRFRHDNGTVDNTATLAAAPSWGDTVELRGVLNADGTTLVGQSINAGTETTATRVTASSLGSAWVDTRIYIGSRGTSDIGMNPIIAVKAARGVQTMAFMRALG